MADTSTQQMALTRDTGPGGFMERVQAMLAFVTPTILNEPAATPYHQPRAYYAQTRRRQSAPGRRARRPAGRHGRQHRRDDDL